MYDALHYCHSWYHMTSVLLFRWKTRVSFHRAVFTFRLLDSQSHSSSAAPRFNQLTKFSLRFGDMIFGFLSENALLNSCLTFFFFFLLLMLQLWISSQRDQLHNSLIPLLSQARSLWVEQKQSLPESNTAAPLSWLRCASLFSQSYTVHTRAHTLACITPRHRQWTLRVVSHQRKVGVFLLMYWCDKRWTLKEHT